MTPLELTSRGTLPQDGAAGALVGRVMRPGVGPSVVAVRAEAVIDVTHAFPTVSDLCEHDDPAAALSETQGEPLGPLEAILAATAPERRRNDRPYLLAPVDLQCIKAAGVTFVVSLLERVIEEQARGDPQRAETLRTEITATLGGDLASLKPGSEEAAALKRQLVQKGAWSQYLEVGIGPDAEIFTKAPVLSAVGTGADIGLHPISSWNNPEPEVAVVASSKGRIVGATLGNDVNLRDVEGRSALLLGKAKDNNASAALGPFLRLFDASFTPGHLRRIEVSLTVEGVDGFRLSGSSSMRMIGRDPDDLVAQACGAHHQYPDGFVLYLGTMFAPVEDRGAPGRGFTHALGDVVTIAAPALGALVNRVRLSTEAEPWTFGIRDLMRNLAGRGLL